MSVRAKIKSRKTWVLSAAIISAYLAGSLTAAFINKPANNEAWFAQPGMQLAQGRGFGTPVLAGSFAWLRGIGDHTYWTMPLYGVVQAVWYSVLGFGLHRQRLFTIGCGMVVMWSLFEIVRSLMGDARPAFLAVAILATDYVFLRLSGFGRMDMLAAAFGFAGIAFFLCWRERNLSMALTVSNALVACSCLTHPCGIMPLVALLVLIWHFARKSMRPKYYVFAAMPYLIGLLIWGLYIAAAPADFISQFAGNVNGVASAVSGNSRLAFVTHPLTALTMEWQKRYVASYDGVLVPLVYLAAVLLLAGQAWRKGGRGESVLLTLTAIFCVVLTVLDGLKEIFYLVWVIPLLAASLAVVLFDAWERRPRLAPLLVIGICLFAVYQQAVFWRYVRTDPYHQEYMTAIHFLESRDAENTSMIGSAEICYALGFRPNIRDDFALGYLSATNPDYIVANKTYRAWWNSKQPDDSRAFAQRRLAEEYRIVFQNKDYSIYQRTSLDPTR